LFFYIFILLFFFQEAATANKSRRVWQTGPGIKVASAASKAETHDTEEILMQNDISPIVIPFNRNFTFLTTSSRGMNLRAIEAMDEDVIAQTEMLGKLFGLAQILTLTRLILEDPTHPDTNFQKLTDNDMALRANTEILKYLVAIKSSRADEFMARTRKCELNEETCKDVITREELRNYILTTKKNVLTFYRLHKIAIDKSYESAKASFTEE
jgi:hypothetical protein